MPGRASTAVFSSFFNISGAPSYSGDFTTLLFRNALIPAFLEELLFRYLPILLFAPHGKWRAVVLSSVLFALAHASVYQMPYALIAGVIFITADLIFDSIIPSLAFHLLNNAVSVIWMFYINTDTRITVFVSVLSASVLAGLLSLLTSVAGLPEVDR
jgi:membrane protease YdiL (CAAX protease family)